MVTLPQLVSAWIRDSPLSLSDMRDGLERERVSVSLSALKQWSAGRNAPSPRLLIPLLSVLQVGPAQVALAKEAVFCREAA